MMDVLSIAVSIVGAYLVVILAGLCLLAAGVSAGRLVRRIVRPLTYRPDVAAMRRELGYGDRA